MWVEYAGFALRNVPVEDQAVPEGIVSVNGEWYYDEYSGNGGVRAIAGDDAKVPQQGTEDEKKSILDLFKR